MIDACGKRDGREFLRFSRAAGKVVEVASKRPVELDIGGLFVTFEAAGRIVTVAVDVFVDDAALGAALRKMRGDGGAE